MKSRLHLKGFLVFSALVISPFVGASEPEPCSISVGIAARTGFYRTWTNALETIVLEQKGLTVCQDDRSRGCPSQFHLEIRYYLDNSTRNIRISSGNELLFDQDYPGDQMSQRMLKTIPTCEELADLI